MAENDNASGTAPAAAEGAPATPQKRSPGHRGADVKDTVAEMAAKAHEISLEAGSKMAAAMKDVVNAAAGLSGFVMESARDLVQYMVRRGQMTQEEADKLIRQVEEHQPKRKAPPPPPPAKAAHAPVHHAPSHHAPVHHAPSHHAPAPHAKPAAKPAAKPVAKTAAKHAPPKAARKSSKPAAKPASKPAAKKAAKPAAKAPAKKAAKKPAAKKPAQRK